MSPSFKTIPASDELATVERDLRFHPVIAAYLHRRHYAPTGRHLRSCHPRDLLDQVTALCRYRGIEPILSQEMLDAACAAYFIDQRDAADEDPVPQPPKQRRHIEVR